LLAGRWHPALVLNVSEGGLFAQTDSAPGVGDPIQARLGANEQRDPITVWGVVAHRRTLACALPSAVGMGLGLRIENVPERYREFVHSVASGAVAAVDAPCVRGSILAQAVEHVCLLRDEGFAPSERLEEGKIAPDGWYWLTSLDRMLRVLLVSVCGGNPVRLAQQVGELGKGLLSSEAFTHFLREARQRGLAAGDMVALRAEQDLFRGSRWRFEGDSLGDFRIVVDEAHDLPEAVRFAIQGGLELVFSQIALHPVSVMSIRLARGAVVYRGQCID
jgi:hypothetical protein